MTDIVNLDIDTENLSEGDLLDDLAVLNITYAGNNATMPTLVPFDVSDDTIRHMSEEAVRCGNITGMPKDEHADFTDFVVDRFPAADGLPNRLFLRPKTPFG